MHYDPRSREIHGGKAHPFDSAAPHIDNGSARPSPERYYDPAWVKAEWDRVFTKTWLLAGPVSDVREPGDFLRFEIGVESFIIVRGDDGEVRAHYNVCPHRGSRLILGDTGSLAKFTCPFHSWQFDLEGRNIVITDRETFQPQVLCHDHNLTSVRCEVAAGLVFISMSDDVPPLKDWLAPILPKLETYDMASMHVVQHRRSEWGANWKGGIDAFYESYHLHAIHPQTIGMLDDRTHIDLYPGGFSRQYVPFGQPNSHHPDQAGLNPGIEAMLRDVGVDPMDVAEGAKGSRAAIANAKRARAVRWGLDYDKFSDSQLTDSAIFGVFPNAQIGCHPEAVFLHRFLPNGGDPGRFTYETVILYKHVDMPGYGAPAWMGLGTDVDLTGETRPDVVHTGLGEPPGMGEVLDQDSELLPIVQAGARSRGFLGPLWSEQEARLRHFHHELERCLAL